VIDSIKVFGERHCGTNAIGYFVGQNFNLQTQRHDFLGWKHRLAPEQAEWSRFDLEKCLFIFCLRNPYSWLKAMHKEPYYEHYPKIKELSFEDFLKFSIEDYENSIAMWNKKNLSYLRMAKEVPHSIIINVEEFHSSQEKIHADLQQVLSKDNVSFIPMNEYVNGRGRHDNKDIESSLAIPSYAAHVTELIHAFLSEEVMEQCNYIKV
jgi:hypothetical protein